MIDFEGHVAISRTSLGLGTLHLRPDTGYRISRNGIGPGGQEFERSHASSIYVNGDYLTHKRKGMQRVQMVVRVTAANANQLHSRIQSLVEAVDQYQFTMTVTIDGIVFEWKCEAADWVIGDSGAWDDLMLRSNTQYVSLDIPRFPDGVA